MGSTAIATTWPDAVYARAYEGLSGAWRLGVRVRPVARHAAELERTQWLHADAIERFQVEALRSLLRFAGARIPYYRDLFARLRFDFRSIRSRADLAQLPPLTPGVVRERIADLVDPAQTGDAEAWRAAVRARSYGWAGYRPGLPALFYGDVHGRRGPTARLNEALRREVHLDAGPVSDESMDRTACAVEHARPHAVVASTRAVAAFARWVNATRRRRWADAAVVCVGDELVSADRAAIARAFGPRVFETYGTRDVLVAAECRAHGGMHVNEEGVVLEVVCDGEGVPPGADGDVVVTDLHDYAMPLVRFATGDRARLAARAPCSCGRWLRRMERVRERPDDQPRSRRFADILRAAPATSS